MSAAERRIEPFRGSFHSQYIKTPSQRDKRNKLPRLLDCLLVIARRGEVMYLAEPAAGEFAVIDCKEGEKGFFEIPPGASPFHLHSMVEGLFGVAAERVGEFVWVV